MSVKYPLTKEGIKVNPKNRDDTTKWSKENFDDDLEDMDYHNGYPMVEGFYHCPVYSLGGADSYAGNGTFGNYKGFKVSNEKVFVF